MRYINMVEFSLLYLIFGIVITILYKLFNKNNNKIQMIDIVVCLILIFISSIRVNVGSDYFAYYLRYNFILVRYHSIHEILINSNAILFDIICYIVKLLFKGNYAIFSICSILMYIPLFIYFRKKSTKPYLYLFLFIISSFYLITNNIIRHSFAMIIFFFSAYLLKDKKYLLFILSIIVASLFHKTVIIAYIILLLTKKIKFTQKNLIIFNVLGIVGYILFDYLIKCLSFLIDNKYMAYINAGYDHMIKQSTAVLVYIVVFNVIVFILLKNRDKIKTSNNILSSFLLAITISYISLKCWPINRISIYIYFFIIPIAAELLSKIKNKDKLLVYFLLIIWSFLIVIFSGDNEYYKYSTWLDDKTVPNYPRNVVKMEEW